MGRALVIKNANFEANALETITFVEEIPCTALTLSANTATFEYFGDTVTITATPTPSNTTDYVAWSSSNDEVASVANGVITLNGLGSATITATCGSVTATVTISQSSAKVPNLQKVRGIYVGKHSDDVPATVLYGVAGTENDRYFIAQAYNADDENLHVEGGYDRGLQAILIPYGATRFALETTDGTDFYLRMYLGDSVNRIEYNGTYWVQYLSYSEKKISQFPDVVPTQTIMLLASNSTLFEKVTGAYFSVE